MERDKTAEEVGEGESPSADGERERSSKAEGGQRWLPKYGKPTLGLRLALGNEKGWVHTTWAKSERVYSHCMVD